MKTYQFSKIAFTVFLLAYSAFVLAEKVSNPGVIFSVIQEDQEHKNYTAKLVLKNLPHAGQWELGFTSIRKILAIDKAEIVKSKQAGDFYLIRFEVPKGNNSIAFGVHSGDVLKKYTDAPLGYFLVENPSSKHPLVLPIKDVATHLLPQQSISSEDELSKNQKKNATSIEDNPVTTTLTADTSLIVPLPAELARQSGQFVFNRKTQILIADRIAGKAAAFFKEVVSPAMGYQLSQHFYKDQLLQNTILFTKQDADKLLQPDQQAEGYVLEVTPDNITIRALSDAGFFYGIQSLRQLFPPEIYAKKLFSQIKWQVPAVYIKDYPRFSYRGLHLDVARHFIPTKQVKRLIDLMAIHKLNYFQWHLTDDEGWRIQIKKYPQLTAKGAWRGYDPAVRDTRYSLFPAFGSGSARYGGYYTQQEIRTIVQYAKVRHVEIVPEIDMPGHARAMIMSLPNDLVDQTDHSVYESIQGYHDNVLSPCKESTFREIDNVMTEVAELFPGKYIHIGADEVPKGVWKKSCMAKQYNPNDPKFEEQVQDVFLKKVQQIITAKHKTMAGWEEVAHEGSTLPAPLLVYIWNIAKIEQVYKTSTQNGYKIIMAPAENLYFDLAYNADPAEPGQYWAGYVDTFSPYVFKPIDKSKGQSRDVIKGVQGELWSEFIDSPQRLDYLAFPKMTGLAELAWTPADRRNWKNFSDRMRILHLLRLKQYGVDYRKVEFDPR